MESTTKKHSTFVENPLKDADLKDLPGIGDAMAKKLVACEVRNAKQLMGQYLVHNKDSEDRICRKHTTCVVFYCLPYAHFSLSNCSGSGGSFRIVTMKK